jgi:hypothetical protein
MNKEQESVLQTVGNHGPRHGKPLSLVTVFPPQAFLLSATFYLSGYKAGEISFCLLDGVNQFGFFQTSDLDSLFLCDGFDLLDFHDSNLLAGNLAE